MGQPHQLLSLDEGPSKGAATQIKTQILLLPGMAVAEGVQARGDPTQGQGPNTFHFLPLELLPQELFERSGRSGHFFYLRTSECPCQRDQADEKCLGKLLVGDRCQWELKKSLSSVNRERPSHYLPFPHSKVFRVILFFFFFF